MQKATPRPIAQTRTSSLLRTAAKKTGIGTLRFRSKLAEAAVYALLPIGLLAFALLFMFPIAWLALALLFMLLCSFAFIWRKSKSLVAGIGEKGHPTVSGRDRRGG